MKLKLAIKIILFLIGIFLVWRILDEVDLTEVGARLQDMKAGIVLIIFINVISVTVDTLTWRVILGKACLGARRFWELWKIRMVGASYNQLIPAGGIAGEPIKAILMKRFLGIGYRESSASMVAFETVNLLALVAFSAVAYLICAAQDSVLIGLGWMLPVGLSVFSVAIVGFFLFQRFRVASILLSIVTRGWWRQRIEKMVAGTKHIEDWLVDFYVNRKRQFSISFVLSILTIVMGAVEIYVASIFLNSPIDFWICLPAAAFIEVVKAGTFFVPARLGTQDVAIVSVVALVTGSASTGLSMAVVRRIRELVMILWGVAIGWRYSLRVRVPPMEGA